MSPLLKVQRPYRRPFTQVKIGEQLLPQNNSLNPTNRKCKRKKDSRLGIRSALKSSLKLKEELSCRVVVYQSTKNHQSYSTILLANNFHVAYAASLPLYFYLCADALFQRLHVRDNANHFAAGLQVF